MSKKNINLSSDSSSFLHSVSQETKEHFDSLIKNALHKTDKFKKGSNNQKRNTKTHISEPCALKTSTINNVLDDSKSLKEENFILEKFLSDAVISNIERNISPKLKSITKIPVPLPRKSKNKTEKQSSPVCVQETYSISSPVLETVELLGDFDRLSTCSKNTYNVIHPQISNPDQNDDLVSNTSKGTYNIYKSDHQKQSIESNSSDKEDESEIPVGDILFHHNTPKTKSIIKILHKKKRKDNDSTENTSEESLRSSKFRYENDKQQYGKAKNTLEEEKIVQTVQLEAKETDEVEFNDTYIRKENKEKIKIKGKLSGTKKYARKLLLSYEDLIGILVYKTDKLLLNSSIHHPCVKIHVVDSETGEYLRKSKALGGDDNVSQEVEYIFPLITKSYELQRYRSIIPNWEELIIFDEDFDYLLQCKESVIIFFEILDFLSFSDASSNYSKEGSNSGWHKVAWAFIKLLSKTGQLNTEEKIRLQLYKPKRSIVHKSSNRCFLYDWWCKGTLTKYPSTLHVCIKRVKASSLKESRHSDAVFKSGIDLDTIENRGMNTEEENKNLLRYNTNENVLLWSRMANQTCKVPNNISATFKSALKGCFGVKFSNNGLLVACGITDAEKSPIIVYSTITKEEYCRFAGHQGIIYNLYWSSDDRFLLSSSADCTVCLWSVHIKKYYPKQVLPHPTFVYCAILNENLVQIITGCYDQVIRIWNASAIDSEFELLQELDGHTAYITSLCFGEDENVLFSSDSAGVIIEWNFTSKEWILKRTLQFKELRKTVINNIKLHPGTKRMIIFCRDSIHRMIDLTVGCIIQWYRGILNYRIHTNGNLSPCGNLVLAASEDGSIFFWNTDTGALLSTYNPYSTITKDTVVTNYIDCHPFDHMIVISHYGSPVPILLCNYNARNEEKTNACSAIVQNSNLQREIGTKKKTKVKSKNADNTTSNISFDVIMDKIDNLLVSPEKNKNV